MYRINILLVFFFATIAVNAQNSQKKEPLEPFVLSDMPSFGEQIDKNNAISAVEMSEKYRILKATDTIQAKFTATVIEVCQSSGCWMKLQLKDGQETMVRFKDYGFFMPKNIKGKEVFVNGSAFVEEMSVADQKHFAKDGGRSESEIAKITTAKRSFGFEAAGVLLKE